MGDPTVLKNLVLKNSEPTTGRSMRPFCFYKRDIAMQSTQIKSHNQTSIDIDAARSKANRPPVTFEAQLGELMDLFGVPNFTDCGSPEWAVATDTGQTGIVKMLNPNKAEVRSDSNTLVNAVLIASELHRENSAARKGKSTKLDEAIQSAHTIYESIVTVHGKDYARIVEIAVCCRKFMEIIGATTGSLVHHDLMPEVVADKLNEAGAGLMAKVLGTATRLGDVSITSPGDAEEVVKWADRIIETEQTGLLHYLQEASGNAKE